MQDISHIILRIADHETERFFNNNLRETLRKAFAGAQGGKTQEREPTSHPLPVTENGWAQHVLHQKPNESSRSSTCSWLCLLNQTFSRFFDIFDVVATHEIGT